MHSRISSVYIREGTVQIEWREAQSNPSTFFSSGRGIRAGKNCLGETSHHQHSNSSQNFGFSIPKSVAYRRASFQSFLDQKSTHSVSLECSPSTCYAKRVGRRMDSRLSRFQSLVLSFCFDTRSSGQLAKRISYLRGQIVFGRKIMHS
jgi:hypothetical protein